ncbi:MAG TPA: nucleoside hydrolase [Bryobacteraceae bacterium]|nr:nucleoside hydrolase [Bryobacteraceae bacterium]
MPRVFLIDTDTASDDAVALIMALRAPDVHVAAITVVSGNVPLEQATLNALYTVELCGSTVPVYAGQARPLRREPRYAHWFHGRDGLGDQGYPAPKGRAESKHAVDAIIDTVSANPGIVLVTLGPLTNVALALEKSPGIAGNVSRCVVMGGNPCTEGNVTPAAEFNMWVDPEAARAVLRSGLPIELVGWQLCRGEANLLATDIEHVLGLGNELAKFTIDCNRRAMEANRVQTGEIGIPLPDPSAMAIAIDPSICTRSSRHYVDVETESELTRGMTVVDRLGVAGDERNRMVWASLIDRGPNACVCWELDIRRWKGLLFRLLQMRLKTASYERRKRTR